MKFQVKVTMRSGREILTDVEEQTEDEVLEFARSLMNMISTEMVSVRLTGVRVDGVFRPVIAFNPKEIESAEVIIPDADEVATLFDN